MQTPDSTITIVTLALLIGVGFVFYQIYRLSKSISRRKAIKAEILQKKQRQAAVKDKDAALAKFKKVHAKVRDNRKKLADEINKNPQKTTAALRRMMKK